MNPDDMQSEPIAVCGAGPAGLAAALTIAKQGRQAVVYERHADVGHRFHGDFQGIENWTSSGDVLEELAALGIEATFEYMPFREVVLYDPDGREYNVRASDPFFYIVRRGAEAGTLDNALKEQALSLGVPIHFNTPCSHLPNGGIVAQGPHRADAIAVGYVFETEQADGAFGVLSERLAPKAYAYLLINAGRGTLATCLFEDFHNERDYLERTVAFFHDRVGVVMKNARRFGGSGNFLVPHTACKGSILYAGETAGFQDFFAGFGMRYAMISGHLAARALLTGRPQEYDSLWQRHFGGLLRASVVNRYLYAMLGDGGYRWFARGLARTIDPRARLRRLYAPSFWKALIYPVAQRAVMRRMRVTCVMEGCTCTWCRCQRAAVAS